MNSIEAPSPHQLASTISDAITCEIGVKVHLHLLRHLAAYTYLKRHPGRLDDVRRILGHKDPKTTASFYVAFQDFAAAERFDEVIMAERRATRTLALASRSRPGRPRGPGKGGAK
jgi:integrase